MINCPQCKAPVDGLTCVSCGYSELVAAPPLTDTQRAVATARQRYLDGITDYPQPQPPRDPPDQAGLRKLRIALAHFQKVKPHPRMWAYRILQRHARGEHITIVALEAAREAYRDIPGLPDPRLAAREPGSDDV